MDKQILTAIEEAYRKGLREGNATKDIKPHLTTSQVVAHEIANKFCKAHVSRSACDHQWESVEPGYSNTTAICVKCGIED